VEVENEAKPPSNVYMLRTTKIYVQHQLIALYIQHGIKYAGFIVVDLRYVTHEA